MEVKPSPRDCIESILADLNEEDYERAQLKLWMLAGVELTTSNDFIMYAICERNVEDKTFCKICGKEIRQGLSTCGVRCENQLKKVETNQKEIVPTKIGQWYFIQHPGHQQCDSKIIFERTGSKVEAIIYELGKKPSTKPGRAYEEDLKEVGKLPGSKILVDNLSCSQKRSMNQRGLFPPVSQTRIDKLSIERQDFILSNLEPCGDWSISFLRKYGLIEKICEIHISETG